MKMNKILLLVILFQSISIISSAQKIQIGAGVGFPSLLNAEMLMSNNNKIAAGGFIEYNFQNINPVPAAGVIIMNNFNKNNKNSGMVSRAGIGNVNDKIKILYAAGYYQQIEIDIFYLRPQFELLIFQKVGFNFTLNAGIKL